ncbi:phospholipase D-like domain-containing protein [Variovorax sp. J22R133]|uniref:phospholipase D-like domain-containing protein n=1 Tax=Variovorax brevis TaxID=3053503 RepID=UPI002575F5AB|nr:phospholipase D-like domain-containing protein [Variovorax sp. J22R133]MDM0114511.1 phospholipase D-like domain-containing protein [Variovorax sp. J22R133]
MSTPPQTQQKSVIPLSDETCSATGSMQWKLEQNIDAKTPVFHFNNLSVYICGKDSFNKIAEDIRNAEESIDIIAWGFDPAMELENRTLGPWPRGATYGDLLRDAAQGELNSGKKVRVRLLCWHSDLAVLLAGNNMPGYKLASNYEVQLGSFDSFGSALHQGKPNTSLHVATRVQDRRALFNARWFRDVVAGNIESLSLRTRGGVHADVVADLKKEAERGIHVSGIERLGLELVATHHQKTIVIDYGGKNPRAYVMGLNSVTDYWDTEEHVYNDLRRGENFEGDDKDHSVGKDWTHASSGQPTLKPYQDYVCRIEGDAVAGVYKNFVEAWNKAEAKGKGAGSPAAEEVNLNAPSKHLSRNLKAACSRAQILRTLPDQEGGERSIERLYYQASSFARHYLYIENQYFQHTDWARALKAARLKLVNACTQGKQPVAMADIPVLHVMVVIPTPERGLMVPRTHDTVAELGYGDSAPKQDAMIRQELEQHAQYERDFANYTNTNKTHRVRKEVYPVSPPRTPPPMSELAQSHLAASKGKESQAVRDTLASTLGMRTLVASLWTYDGNWSQANLPIAKLIEEEKQRYTRQTMEWDRLYAGQSRSMPSSMPPRPEPPPNRSQKLRNAVAQRYREVYIHSKLMVIDDSMFTLGSANLNLRSFAVDSEMNIASDDARLARRLRQQVWAQHTKGRFDGGGTATVKTAIEGTFKDWEKEAAANLDKKIGGKSLTSFLVQFLDERTSAIRGG